MADLPVLFGTPLTGLARLGGKIDRNRRETPGPGKQGGACNPDRGFSPPRHKGCCIHRRDPTCGSFVCLLPLCLSGQVERRWLAPTGD